MSEAVEADMTTKKSISQPPLDLLFNPSVLSKKDVWEIDVSLLLEMLLKLINKSGKKDLRMCGIAALSSSLIYRLKVESILRLERISKTKKFHLESNLLILLRWKNYCMYLKI